MALEHERAQHAEFVRGERLAVQLAGEKQVEEAVDTLGKQAQHVERVLMSALQRSAERDEEVCGVSVSCLTI